MAQLIVALDVPSADEAERLIDRLYDLDVIFKIGMESLYGYPERIFSYCEARRTNFWDFPKCDIARDVVGYRGMGNTFTFPARLAVVPIVVVLAVGCGHAQRPARSTAAALVPVMSLVLAVRLMETNVFAPRWHGSM